MTLASERVCIGCGESEEMVRLERCTVCGKDFCADCGWRATGRRFCSQECAHAFFFHGETDDDDEDLQPDD